MIALVVVAALPGTTALATAPGTNGRIAFHRADANGFNQTWTANPDLTAQLQLTTGLANSGTPAGRRTPAGSHSTATAPTRT